MCGEPTDPSEILYNVSLDLAIAIQSGNECFVFVLLLLGLYPMPNKTL